MGNAFRAGVAAGLCCLLFASVTGPARAQSLSVPWCVGGVIDRNQGICTLTQDRELRLYIPVLLDGAPVVCKGGTQVAIDPGSIYQGDIETVYKCTLAKTFQFQGAMGYMGSAMVHLPATTCPAGTTVNTREKPFLHACSGGAATTPVRPTPPPAASATAKRLNLVLTAGAGEPRAYIQGARIVLRVDGKERSLLTDASGIAKDLVDFDAAKPPAIVWDRIEVPASAVLHRPAEPLRPLYPALPQGAPMWAFPVKQTLKIPSDPYPTLRAEAAAPLAPVLIGITAWDPTARTLKGTQAALAVYAGRSRYVRDNLLASLRADAVPQNGELVIYVPVFENASYGKLTFVATANSATVRGSAVRFIDVPRTVADTSNALILAIATDVLVQLGLTRYDFKKTLLNAGLSPDQVNRILAVPVRIGNATEYDDATRTITVLPSDLTRDQDAATIFHEYTHAISDAIGVNENIPPGGHHDVNDVTGFGTAWDEGRAHYLGSLIAETMGIPANLDQYGKQSATAWRGDVESQVARALGELFRDTNAFPSDEARLKLFFAAEYKCVEMRGHTPRNVDDFLSMVELTAPSPAARQDAARILSRLTARPPRTT